MQTNYQHRYQPTPGNAAFTNELAIDRAYPDFSYWRSNDGGEDRGFQIMGKEGLFFGKPVFVILKEFTNPKASPKRIPLDVFAAQVKTGNLISFQPKV